MDLSPVAPDWTLSQHSCSVGVFGRIRTFKRCVDRWGRLTIQAAVIQNKGANSPCPLLVKGLILLKTPLKCKTVPVSIYLYIFIFIYVLYESYFTLHLCVRGTRGRWEDEDFSRTYKNEKKKKGFWTKSMFFIFLFITSVATYSLISSGDADLTPDRDGFSFRPQIVCFSVDSQPARWCCPVVCRRGKHLHQLKWTLSRTPDPGPGL